MVMSTRTLLYSVSKLATIAKKETLGTRGVPAASTTVVIVEVCD
jgi:hypothetical protein